MQRVPKVVLLGALFTTFLAEGAVLYFIEGRNVRLFAGLALFLVIAWMLATPQVADVIAELPDQLRRRHYPKLRAQVSLLLAEVRRLHWTAVDLDRGTRSREDATTDMDATEERMRGLLQTIRREAGVASDEPDPGPADPEATPDEPMEGEA